MLIGLKSIQRNLIFYFKKIRIVHTIEDENIKWKEK